MTDKGLFSCTFEARAVGIPEHEYEKYVESRATASGVRGFIQPVGEDMYFGKLEGTKFAIDFMKDVLVDPTEYYDELQDITFSKLNELNTFSCHSFHIINDCKQNDCVRVDFCNMAYDMMEQNATRVEQVKEIINSKAKNVFDVLQKNSEQLGQNVQSVLQPTIEKMLDIKQQAAYFLYKVCLKATMALSRHCGVATSPRRLGVQTQTVNFQSHTPF